MPWCAEIRSVLSRLRWCDASSDMEGALNDLEKIFVQFEAWRWSRIDNIVTLNRAWCAWRKHKPSLILGRTLSRVDENSFHHTFLLGRAKTETLTYGCFHLWKWLSMFTKCIDVSTELRFYHIHNVIESLLNVKEVRVGLVRAKLRICGELYELHAILDECALRICVSPKHNCNLRDTKPCDFVSACFFLLSLMRIAGYVRAFKRIFAPRSANEDPKDKELPQEVERIMLEFDRQAREDGERLSWCAQEQYPEDAGLWRASPIAQAGNIRAAQCPMDTFGKDH
ncbi:unnamed protein product [Brugia pahangi]|uniref:Reverse transcriptase n=1 Tax=Brugia pahangi TaxID=6280 RepID=A0A0N4TTA5_BRUPA|nr:unnamed protein product [Brugia pahangi]